MTVRPGVPVVRAWPLLLALLAASCGASTSSITSLTGDATNGATIYAAQCQRCHGADGTSGPYPERVPSTVRSNVDLAISRILNGDDEMPAFASTLTDQEIADLLAYVRTL